MILHKHYTYPPWLTIAYVGSYYFYNHYPVFIKKMLYAVEPCLWTDVSNAHRLPATNFEVSVICLQMVHTAAVVMGRTAATDQHPIQPNLSHPLLS